MKPSILITVLILVTGALPAIHQRQRAAAIRMECGELGKEAAALGIDLSAGPTAIASRAKRQRLESEQRAQAITAAILSLAREVGPDAMPAGHPDEVPGMVDENAALSVIAGAAANDPKLAFRIIDELELEDPSVAIHAIISAGVEDDKTRTELLLALRSHLETIDDETRREQFSSIAMEHLGRSGGADFDSLSGWIKRVDLSPDEKSQLAAGLSWFTAKEETGRWVEWVAENLPEPGMAGAVRALVGEWTQQDYVAAGLWLAANPESPGRIVAVESYAAAVAQYEPEIAAQWALTLPPGPSRAATLRAVYENWPLSDPQGAALFAIENEID